MYFYIVHLLYIYMMLRFVGTLIKHMMMMMMKTIFLNNICLIFVKFVHTLTPSCNQFGMAKLLHLIKKGQNSDYYFAVYVLAALRASLVRV